MERQSVSGRCPTRRQSVSVLLCAAGPSLSEESFTYIHTERAWGHGGARPHARPDRGVRQVFAWNACQQGHERPYQSEWRNLRVNIGVRT